MDLSNLHKMNYSMKDKTLWSLEQIHLEMFLFRRLLGH